MSQRSADARPSSGGAQHTPERADADHDLLLAELKPAQTLCRMIGFGAFITGVVMVIFSGAVEATTDSAVVDSVVHLSNVKFMAAMWAVIGVIFAVGASSLHEQAAWRLLRLACIGISISAVVRLIEMMRLDSYETYGIAAAAIELVVPGLVIYLTERAYRRTSQ